MTWNRTHTTAGECRDNNPGTKSTPTLYSTFQQTTNNKKTQTHNIWDSREALCGDLTLTGLGMGNSKWELE